MSQSDAGAKLRTFVKRLYSVPGVGYLVRLGVALARLPAAQGYHAALLKNLDDRLLNLEARSVDLTEQARLVARLATLLEELRAQQAQTKAELQRGAEGISKALDFWLAELLNRSTLHEVTLQRLRKTVLPEVADREAQNLAIEEGTEAELRRSIDDLRNELFSQTGALEAELAKRGLELRKVTDYLSNRIDFVRRETLFELRFGEDPIPTKRPEMEARILDPEKLRSIQSGDYRINVGCGHIPLESYINVDRRELPSVDVVAEAGDMPFQKESLAELFSAHLIEHFPQERFRREILPYWRSLLRPGGTLRAVAPDAAAMIRGYAEGAVSYEDLREVTFGTQDYDGDFHFNMFTPESLTRLLEEAGFVEVRCPETARRNGRCFEFEIVAVKPSGLHPEPP